MTSPATETRKPGARSQKSVSSSTSGRAEPLVIATVNLKTGFDRPPSATRPVAAHPSTPATRSRRPESLARTAKPSVETTTGTTSHTASATNGQSGFTTLLRGRLEAGTIGETPSPSSRGTGPDIVPAVPNVITVRQRVLFGVALVLLAWLLATEPAVAHEQQVIRFGSFLGGFTHPVLGLDHFLAMVSVGVVSAMLGGRSIWVVPGLFVTAMTVGGLLGLVDLGIGMGLIEGGIGISVVLLGAAIAADRSLPVKLVMGAVIFFGAFHGYAHGVEIPSVARPVLYILGYLSGTIMIHLLGVLIGEVAKRYARGRLVLRVLGGASAVVGALFLAGVL
ncbi:MAG: HupE/UreJ family protein [Acidimicrobiia bacterium]|nr:HupE/UreJ family protein [Acidimicrobiia bacterium]